MCPLVSFYVIEDDCMNIKPAIVVVAYNRAKSMQRLLDSIACAEYPYKGITLIISIDYHPQNGDVLKAANDYVWPYGEKIVRTHEKRMGLKAHVLECGNYSDEYGCIIMLEDDLVAAPDFYHYTIATQEYYKNDSRVAGVALYCNEWNNFSFMAFRPLRTPFDAYFRQTCESW